MPLSEVNSERRQTTGSNVLADANIFSHGRKSNNIKPLLNNNTSVVVVPIESFLGNLIVSAGEGSISTNTGKSINPNVHIHFGGLSSEVLYNNGK